MDGEIFSKMTSLTGSFLERKLLSSSMPGNCDGPGQFSVAIIVDT